MKNLLLAILLTLVSSIQPASANTITIDETLTDSDTLVFDVVWGSSQTLPSAADDQLGAGFVQVQELIFTEFLPTFLILHGGFPGFSPDVFTIILTSNLNRTFADADDIIDFSGTSISATPDGFGAHVVYQLEPAVVPPPDGSAPVGGSLGLFAIAAAALCAVGWRRRARLAPVTAT